MSYMIEKLSEFFKVNTKIKGTQRPLKNRRLHLEPLEERQLLSASQWDEDCFDAPVFDDQERDYYDDDALIFDEDMFASEWEYWEHIDTMEEWDAELFGPDPELEPVLEDDFPVIHGPLTFEDYCLRHDPWVFLLEENSLSPGQLLQTPPSSIKSSPGKGSPNPSSPRGGSNFVYDNTYIVTTLLDVVNANDGVLSLREAIAVANASVGTTLITFDEALTGTITLNGTALPTITNSVDVIGPGADVLTISGNDLSRIFYANKANTEVVLAGMTLANGSGGGFWRGDLRVKLRFDS